MHFQHTDEIWRDFPALVPAVLHVTGITADIDATAHLEPWYETARARLAVASEGEFPEIQAWRRAFAKMGLKPTQYRCASESLLRRFRKEDSLPRIHPLIDLCNAISLAYAIPIAVFDLAGVTTFLEVRRATGDEQSLTLSGEREQPDAGEVIFADAANRVHARRWTNRQSGFSAIRPDSTDILIVAEGLHSTAADDVRRLIDSVAGALDTVWSCAAAPVLLSAATPRFTF